MAKSLSSRLTYRIMAVVLAMLIVITTVVHFFVKEYMLDEARERYLRVMLEGKQEVSRWLSDVYVAMENNVHDIERDIDNPDAMLGHMERILTQNPSIACCALLVEPSYYPAKGRVFIPYARRDTSWAVRVAVADSTYHSDFYDEWFGQLVQKEEGGWTKAYYENEQVAGDQEPRLLTTYTVPIHNREGRPVALLCADLSLGGLRERILENVKEVNDQYEQGLRQQTYFFIIDLKGNYIMHPDRQRMLTQCDKGVSNMLKTQRGTCMMEVDGVMSRLYYRTINEIGWVMVIVTPEDVILFKARRLNIIILMVMLLGLLAIYLFCRHQIKGIADPFAMQKATLDHELKIANGIQMAMLPKMLNPQEPSSPTPLSYDFYASLIPAREVGGDLYDFFLRNNRLFFCIGDVCGKGVPAALMMAVMRAMFRSETRRSNTAADIVNTLNRNLSEEYTAGYFITMFVGVLDLTTGLLNYCNAGHEPAILSGALLPVKPNLPVGALPDWNYEDQHAQLQRDDMLFLYTDGISEAMNTEGKQFGRAHVLQLVNERSCNTSRQLVEFMQDEVHHYVGDAAQSDDITLLAIKWLAPLSGHPTISLLDNNILTLKSSMDDIAQLEPFIANIAQRAGMGSREAKRLRLAVEEAVANIIHYGEATSITLKAEAQPTAPSQAEVQTTTSSQVGMCLLLTIDEDGKPFDPTSASPTDFSVPADQRPSGGLGIMFLHQMTDGLEYQRIDGHNILRIEMSYNHEIVQSI